MAPSPQPLFVLPFAPYRVQVEAMDLVSQTLHSGGRPHAVAAIELPTGCGKTLTLLTSALRFQREMKEMGRGQAEEFLLQRSPADWAVRRRQQKAVKGGTSKPKRRPSSRPAAATQGDDDDDEWAPPRIFFQQFRPGASQKKLRRDFFGEGCRGAAQLEDHGAPPTSIFFVSRTHAQLAQAARELRKLSVSSQKELKMNILSGRDRSCINRKVRSAVAGGMLPAEGNNLGEICDKLVSLGQCQMVQRYLDLATRAISQPIGSSRTNVWDIEDLVMEGGALEGCPYYAARELVFHADVTFATYNYLLDPVIRKESKFEAALKNHSIVVFDEAHNIADVCRDALTHLFTSEQLLLIINEVRPLIEDEGCRRSGAEASETIVADSSSSPGSAFVPTYPRNFCLTEWTLVELFKFFLDGCLLPILKWLDEGKSVSARLASSSSSGTGQQNGSEWLNDVLRSSISSTPHWAAKFKQIYGVLMSLGVTFNPFQFSIHALGLTKRLLAILRFMTLKPSGFAVWREDSEPNAANAFTMRCCDPSLGFKHLSSVCYAVIVASGTLAPFEQLAEDLGLVSTASATRLCMPTLQGDHVIDVGKQCRVAVVTHTSRHPCRTPQLLRCTFSNLQSASFVMGLAECILQLTSSVVGGGSLVFFPNYKLMRQVADIVEDLTRRTHSTDGGSMPYLNLEVFREPSQTELLADVMSEFKRRTIRLARRRYGGDTSDVVTDDFEVSVAQRDVSQAPLAKSTGAASLFGVYRGKLSEGIDFVDEMARLVVCVGVPFQPVTSPFVAAQKNFSGQKWYVADAVRTVNQALGRCIRHKDDYGAIVLLDERFALLTSASGSSSESLAGMLPPWCREAVRTYSSPETCSCELREFLRALHQQQLRKMTEISQRKRDGEKIEGKEFASLRQPKLHNSGAPPQWARAEPFARLCASRSDAATVTTSSSAREPLRRSRTQDKGESVGPSRGWYSVAQKIMCEETDDAENLPPKAVALLAWNLQQRSESSLLIEDDTLS
jgi:Rad3-related DNA helicase